MAAADPSVKAFRVRLDEADEDLAAAELWDLGTRGLESRPAAPGRAEWLAYFPPEITAERLREALAAIPGATVEEVDVPDVDWVKHFREGFQGLTAGRFRIAPVWEEPSPAPDVLILDPGRAFGTGTHESTRLCLAALERLAARGRLGRVLDVGTGTGILAVAAAHLGASTVVAADLDPESTAAAAQHAVLNRVRLRIVRGDGGQPFRAAAFDVVLANISAPLLVERSAEIGRLAAPGGTLVLAGLLLTDLPEVEAAYAPFGAATAATDGEWASLCVRRGAAA